MASGAVAAVYLEPWPQQVQGPLAGVMLLENVFYLVLFGGGVAGLFIARKQPAWRSLLWWAALGLALGYGLFLGLTIPFLGSLMRYRAGPLLLLVPAMVLFFRPFIDQLLQQSAARN